MQRVLICSVLHTGLMDGMRFSDLAFAEVRRQNKPIFYRYRRRLVPLVPCRRPRKLRRSRDRYLPHLILHSHQGGS